jgi:hypothetical protein
MDKNYKKQFIQNNFSKKGLFITKPIKIKDSTTVVAHMYHVPTDRPKKIYQHTLVIPQAYTDKDKIFDEIVNDIADFFGVVEFYEKNKHYPNEK